MGILEDNKREFEETSKRWRQKTEKEIKECKEKGKHDTSDGKLNYIRGTLHGV